MGQTNDSKQKTKHGTRGGTKTPRFDSTRFVAYELDVAQQAACKGWGVTSDDLWQEMLALVDDGYKISIKYDDKSSCYAAFLIGGDDPGDPNHGFILSGRGTTPAKAFKQGLFKHGAIGASWDEFAEKRTPFLDD